MAQVTKTQLEAFGFHPLLVDNVPRVIAQGQRISNASYFVNPPVVLFEQMVLIDWQRYDRALERCETGDGFATVVEFDRRQHRDPLSCLMQIDYLAPAQRVLMAARFLKLVNRLPDYLATFGSALRSIIGGHQLEREKNASKLWGVSHYALARARLILTCEHPGIVAKIEEGYLAIAPAANAISRLGTDHPVYKHIAGLHDTRAINQSLAKAVEQPSATEWFESLAPNPKIVKWFSEFGYRLGPKSTEEGPPPFPGVKKPPPSLH